MTPFQSKIQLYYQEVQAQVADPRDNRGKRHDLAFVLTLFYWSLHRTSGRHKHAKIYRQMKWNHGFVLQQLGCSSPGCISLVQLKRVLDRIDWKEVRRVNAWLSKIEWQSAPDSGKWHSVDGKELRGSIDGSSGQKRGESAVFLVRHQDRYGRVIGFYNGRKEAESTMVKGWIRRTPAEQFAGRKFTFDALHLDEQVLIPLQKKGAIYLVQVKENQPKFLEDCQHVETHLPARGQKVQWDTGHGRREKRQAWFYDLPADCLEPRWQNCGSQTLIVLERQRWNQKTGEHSREICYWISNQKLHKNNMEELFAAVRGHWSVEVNNYVLDQQLGQDHIRCQNQKENQVVATFLQAYLNSLQRNNKCQNLSELREDMARSQARAMEVFAA